MISLPFFVAMMMISIAKASLVLPEEAAVGYSSSCALLDDDSVVCWGDGWLGDGPSKSRMKAGAEVVTDAQQVCSGENFHCVLLLSGKIQCWGAGDNGRLGTGNTNDQEYPADVSLSGTATFIDCGRAHACAVMSDGSMYCWGSNNKEQVGDDSSSDRSTPVKLSIGSGVQASEVACGREHTCFLSTSGKIKCWGEGSGGRLGYGDSDDESAPSNAFVNIGGTAISVVAGDYHTCGLLSGGTLKCWGEGSDGATGLDTSSDRYTPNTVSGAGTVAQVCAGREHTCVRTTSGTVRCTGRNSEGQLGIGSTSSRDTFSSDIDFGDTDDNSNSVEFIACGGYTSLAIFKSKEAKAWGENENGELGIGVSPTPRSPGEALEFGSSTSDVSKVCTGTEFAVALLADGTVWTWGSDDEGQLSQTSTSSSLDAPKQISGVSNAVDIACGYEFFYVVFSDGKIKSVGKNNDEQLGFDSDGDDRTTLASVSISNVAKVAAGEKNACYQMNDDGVRCVGRGDEGANGDGSDSDNKSPPSSNINLGSGKKASKICAGREFAMAMLTEGGLRSWGRNDQGQLGIDSTSSKTSPQTVNLGSDTVIDVACGYQHACIVTTAGTVRCAGSNAYGQIGVGGSTFTTYREFSSPISFAPLTAVAIGAGKYHTCVVLSDGSSKCWGEGGGLGDGGSSIVMTPPSSPISFPGDVDEVLDVTGGSQFTCARARHTDASIHAYCFGSASSSGQLGTGRDTYEDEPNGDDYVVAFAYTFEEYTPYLSRTTACDPTCTVSTLDVISASSAGDYLDFDVYLGTVDGDDASAVTFEASIHGMPCFKVSTTTAWPSDAASDDSTLGLRCEGLVVTADDLSKFDSTLVATESSIHLSYTTLKSLTFLNGLGEPLSSTTPAGTKITLLPVNPDVAITLPSPSSSLSPTASHTLLSPVSRLSNANVSFVIEDLPVISASEVSITVLSSDGLDDVDFQVDVATGRLGDIGGEWVKGMRIETMFCAMGETSSPVNISSTYVSFESWIPVEPPTLSSYESPAMQLNRTNHGDNGQTIQVIVLRGSGFGKVNVSNTHPCEEEWVSAGLEPVSASVFADAIDAEYTPSTVGFWAYLGTRACQRVWWMSDTEVACVPPPSLISPNVTLNATLAIDGFTLSIPTSLSYAPLVPLAGSDIVDADQDGGSIVEIESDWIWMLEAGDDIGVRLDKIVVGPIEINTPSLTFLSNTKASFSLPAGGGSGHVVSLCVTDTSSTSTTIGPTISAVPQESICTPPSTFTISYAAPTLARISPSEDLDPLGAQWITLTGSNFGDPTIMAAMPKFAPTVSLGLQSCVRLVHVDSSTIRCLTPSLQGSVLNTVVQMGTSTSESVLVSILTVSLLAAEPRSVLPSAPGRKTYDFIISVIGPDRVSKVLIGNEWCMNPVKQNDQMVLCESVAPPREWPTDGLVSIFVKGKNDTTNSTRPVLTPMRPPRVIAVSARQGLPSEGGVDLNIVGEGFGIERSDIEAVMVGWDATIWDMIRNGRANEVVSHNYSSPQTAVVFPSTSPDLNWVSSSEVSVRLPPGVGVNVPVFVATVTGLVSTRFNFTYDPPSLTTMTPTFLKPGVAKEHVTLCGTNLAPVASEVEKMMIGGIACPNEAITITTPYKCVSCTSLPTPLSLPEAADDNATSPFPTWPASGIVEMVIGKQSTGPQLGLGTFLPVPVVTDVTPAQVVVNDEVRLRANGLEPLAANFVPPYIVSVLIGGDEVLARKAASNPSKYASAVATSEETVVVSSFTLSSDTQLTFSMPPAAGDGIVVRFFTSTGLMSSPGAEGAGTISTIPASVTSISPEVLLPGQSSLTVVLYGINFPVRQSDLDLVEVGGIACGEGFVVSATQLVCRKLRTPLDDDESWPASFIRITINGQQSGETILPSVKFVNPPRVTGVSPPKANKGTRITLTGSDFGASSNDVQGVYVDNWPCASLLWVSPAQMSCVIPMDHPTWGNATDSDIIPTMSVDVMLTTGIRSDRSTSGASFEPENLRVRPNPWIPVRGIAAWRPLGQRETLVVRWRYPGSISATESLEQYLNAEHDALFTTETTEYTTAVVTEFEVEVSDNVTFPSHDESHRVLVSVGRENAEKYAGIPSHDEEYYAAYDTFELRVPLFTDAPVVVRIAPKNSDGRGPWRMLQSSWFSALGPFVPATCTEGEYLASHESDTNRVVCTDCPIGATCEGFASENVTAAPGYWRVPWSDHSLGFAECLVESACLGTNSAWSVPFVSSDFTTSNSSTTTSTRRVLQTAGMTPEEIWYNSDEEDRPKSLDGHALIPSTVESCEIGSRGVLCSSCDTNYYPGAGEACEPCGSRAWIGGRFFLLCIFVLFVFSIILVRAWGTRANASSKEVQIAKLLVSHLQSIAIVGSVQLRWPAGARGFFAVSDTASSFTTSGLAIECLLGESARSPYARTITILTMPLWLILFAAIFWWVVGKYENTVSWLKALVSPAQSPTPKPTSKDKSAASTALALHQKPIQIDDEGSSEDADEGWGSGDAEEDEGEEGGGGGRGGGGDEVVEGKVGEDDDSEEVKTGGDGVVVNVGESEERGVEKRRKVGDAKFYRRLSSFKEMRERVFEDDAAWSLWQERMLISCIITAFLVHTPLSSAAFRLLTCQSVAPEDNHEASQLRLSMDLDVSCEDPAELGAMLGIGIPMLLFISLGIPIASGLFLYYLGQERLSQPQWKRKISFLIAGFRPNVYWYESVVLLRKVLLAMVTTTLAPSGGGLQVNSSLIVLLVALVVHSRLHPYASGMINNLETFSLITASMTLVGAVYVVLDDADLVGNSAPGSIGVFASVIIAGMNTVFLVVAIALLSRKARAQVRAAYAQFVDRFHLEDIFGDSDLPWRMRFSRPHSRRKSTAPSLADPTKPLPRSTSSSQHSNSFAFAVQRYMSFRAPSTSPQSDRSDTLPADSSFRTSNPLQKLQRKKSTRTRRAMPPLKSRQEE